MPPSPWRLPLTVVMGVTVPPLALVSWILLSGSARTHYLASRWVRLGGWIALVGALPLLGVILAAKVGLWLDPNPNPIGLGLLFVAAGLVGMVCALVGVYQVEVEQRQAAASSERDGSRG